MRAFALAPIAIAPIAIALLANAAAASADTVVGQVAAPTTACTPGTLYQARTATTPRYITPHGVITRWSVQTDSQIAPIKLKVLHSLGNGQYRIVGESDAVMPAANTTQTFDSRIPVGKGDYLGISVISGSADCRFTTANFDDAVRETSTVDPPVGSTVTVPTSHANSRLDVRAVVEPDQDSDGFGDTTQDLCPPDPTSQGPCIADLSVRAVSVFESPRVGRTITWSVTVRNDNRHVGSTANLRWTVPAWVRIGSITSNTASSCRRFYSAGHNQNVVICRQTIPAGGAVNIRIHTTPWAPGWINAHGSVTHATTVDPDPGNNRTTARRFIFGTAPACVNALDGTPLDDHLKGTKAGDVMHGFAGDDRIDGRGGDDCLRGGRGNDLLIGGSGHDRIYGDGGDDVIHAEDGRRDVVRCGSGYDKVYADPVDLVARNCENVVRVAIL